MYWHPIRPHSPWLVTKWGPTRTKSFFLFQICSPDLQVFGEDFEIEIKSYRSSRCGGWL